ncbi:MAG: nitrate- and nitrite sensing domain-containing protein [Pseudomonadales bacterium]|nr:nitrate- and nitrite sensing domain-containing protein [Pseudomonadales bacterium]
MNGVLRLDRLKVASKLFLFLTIPVLCIGFLFVAGVSPRIAEIEDSRKHLEFNRVGESLVALDDALGAERGAALLFAAGVIDRDAYREAQIGTDAAVEALSYQMVDATEQNYFGLHDEFVDLLEQLELLAPMREEALASGKDTSAWYGRVIDLNRRILSFQLVVAGDAGLMRFVQRLLLITELADEAVIERDLGRLVLARGTIDRDTFEAMSASAANQRTLFERYRAFGGHDVAAAPNLLSGRIERYRHDLVASAIDRSTLLDLLTRLETLVSYGVENRERARGEALASLTQIDRLLRGDERTSLDRLSAILRGPVETWELALPVIAEIKRAPQGLLPDDWTSTANARLLDAHKLRRQDAARIEAYLSRREDLASQSLRAFGAITLAGVLVTVLLGVLIGRRVVTGIRSMATSMQGMIESGTFSPVPDVGGDDELTTMVGTFNELVEGRLAAEQRALALQSELLEAERAHAAELEMRVKERTASLKDALAAAQVATRAKSTFLGNISHHVRTPLNAILGYTQLLLLNAPGGTKERGQLERIRENGMELLSLMDSVLTMVRLEKGDVEIASSIVDVREQLGKLTARISSRAKHVPIQLDVADDVPALVSVDAGKIETALFHLLENAVRFTEKGRIRLALSSSQGRLDFLVEDTGIGMSEAEVRQAFHVFDQVVPGCESKGGTGVGLSIVHSIAGLLGGAAKIESVPGEGTRVSLSIPFEPVGQPEAEENVIPVLPDELKSRFGAAVRRADVIEMRELAREVASRDAPSGRALVRMVERYDYDGLARVVGEDSGGR